MQETCGYSDPIAAAHGVEGTCTLSPNHSGDHQLPDLTVLAAGPVHVHVDQRSRDCDGRMDRSWIRPGGFLDILSVYAPVGDSEGIEVTRRGDIVHLYEETDEGFVAYDFEECTDPECDFEEASQRDYTAESMGY